MFQIKKVSDHGTNNPIVARLSIQTSELINSSTLDKEVRDSLFSLYNFEIQPRLLECEQIYNELKNEILIITDGLNNKGLKTQSSGRVVEVPSIMRLNQRTEQFLYSAKSALRDLSKIFNLFYDTDFNEARYDKVLTWTNRELGKESKLSKMIKNDHDLWIEKIVKMRNAIEHPGGYSGTLNIHNFEILADNSVRVPSWHRNDEDRVSISDDMGVFIFNFLEFAEELLIFCLIETSIPEILGIAEIPVDQRNPECPIRFKIIFKGK